VDPALTMVMKTTKKYFNSIFADSETHLNDFWRYDGNWTWMAGSSIGNQNGNYGTKGVASPSNFPGSKRYASNLIDKDGNFWIFGGTNHRGDS
jgi:hypothetical protein